MGECSYNALRPCSLAQSPLQDDHSALSKCVRYLPTSGRLVYRAGVMSKVDPKGYYACLGVEPGRTPTKSGQRFIAARGYTIPTTTRARRRRPAFRSSTKPTERLAIQPHGAPMTGREGALQRRAWDRPWPRSLEADRA